MLENEDLREEEQEEEVEENEVLKKSKIVGGLNPEAKRIIEVFKKDAKAKGKGFTDFASEGLLYVIYWKDDKAYCVPVWDFKENKKIDLTDEKLWISEDAKKMQEIFTMAEALAKKGEE